MLKKLYPSPTESTCKIATWLWYQDNHVKNKLNKIMKLNYQITQC